MGKASVVQGPTEAILENIRRANERKFRERVQSAIRHGDTNPANSLVVDTFRRMWHATGLK